MILKRINLLLINRLDKTPTKNQDTLIAFPIKKKKKRIYDLFYDYYLL